MSLLLLISLSIGLGLLGVCTFFWALRNGQFDDPDGAAWRVISTEHQLEVEGRNDDKLAFDSQDRDARRGL